MSSTASISVSSPAAVSRVSLLSLYGIIPLTLLIAGVDHFFLDSLLIENYLPSNPASLLLWAIIFNFPHIISSFVTLADDEYIPYYKKRFSRALMIIVSVVVGINMLLPWIVPALVANVVYALFFAFFAAYTMYHVLSQQFGIGMMLMKAKPGPIYEWWRYLSTIATTAMYAMVFARVPLMEVPFGVYSLFDAVMLFAGVFVVLAVAVGFYFTRGSKSRLGTWYIYSNLMMLLVTYGFMHAGYDIFVLLIPRFVHDMTAFMIYSTHDQNRNREVQHNYIYRFLSFIPLTPFVLCPIIAIILANFIECSAFLLDLSLGFNVLGSSECQLGRIYQPEVSNGLPFSMQVGMQIMFICGLFHYYIEGFVWKRDAIHRHALSFK
ncbi:MAG: hypothetical protein HRU20_18820 [Pseudomonadales bacterium]|nr:hypothetical protein [Pseudomonadales bacterium]